MFPDKLPKSPALKSNFLSKLFFCWVNDIFWKGSKKDLEPSDLYSVLPEDQSSYLGDRLNEKWNNELKNYNNQKSKKGEPKILLNALIKEFGLKFFLIGLIAFFEECFAKILQPIFLGYLVRYFGGEDGYTKTEGYLFACGLLGGTVLYAIAHHPFFWGVTHLGMRVRIACCSLVYRKALKLSQKALGKTTIGKMVNLLSNDTNRFDVGVVYFHYLWIGPIQTVIINVVVWTYFGWASLLATLVLVLYIPFQIYLGRLFSIRRSDTAVKTDNRIRIMNEIVNGIRVIKMYTWEKPFSQLVHEARQMEVKIIRKTGHLRAINMSMFFTSAKLIFFITFLTYVLTDNTITAEKVFVTLSLYNNSTKLIMTLFFPYGISHTAETLISIKRIQEFLLMEERDVPALTYKKIPNIKKKLKKEKLEKISEDKNEKVEETEEIEVEIKNLSAKWSDDHEDDTLTNINLNLKGGELIAIIGHVGAGKGSLLHAILKELPAKTGSVKVSGKIAYAAQEAWVFNGSVRENILFGKPYEAFWYNQVVDACALRKDFKLFPYSDKTLITGTSVSGGQRARINLARAVYANYDIYLLDDPLSAVDAEVGRHIFEKCINGILAKKARILVTHQLQFLRHVDHIILLNDGQIEVEGNYDKLIKSGIDFAQLLQIEGEEDENENNEKPPAEIIPKRKKLISTRSLSAMSITTIGSSRKDSVLDDEPDIVEESRAAGQLKLSLYYKYIKAGANWCSLLILIFSNLICQVLFTGSDFWLNIWTKEEEDRSKVENRTNKTLSLINGRNAAEKDDFDREQQIIVFSSLIFGLFIFSILRSFNFFDIVMQASINLHRSMFSGIIRAPMSFFETNPIGRVLNRFSKDIGQMDDLLPTTLYDTVEIFLNVIAILIVVSIISPIVIAPVVILSVLFYFLRRFYLKTARGIKRVEGIARSPVFSHLSASLYGLTTIRAFKTEQQMVEQFDKCQDNHSSSWYLFLATTRWFGIRLDWISIVFLACVTFSFMIFTPSSASEIALAISLSMQLTGALQWGCRQSAETENLMISVERVMDYTKIPPEKALYSENNEGPPEEWPKMGEIELENLQLQYGDNKPVLRNLNCTFLPGEKIGICGRTGAGKSSMLTALFRLAEPSGVIKIDGINVLNIGLHELRSKISIIPQDPVLFIGTLRKNLDPFLNFNDDELWRVLQDVHLSEEVKTIPAGLDIEIAEGGSNFSVGQRQLICLGRAILRKNKILVLDEATANVDPETDALIQKTIKDKFSKCTVITIAHRLNTIIDNDRILVLDAGQIKEFGEPYDLLQNKNSSLYSLVEQTGKATAENLFMLAKEASEARKSSKSKHV